MSKVACINTTANLSERDVRVFKEDIKSGAKAEDVVEMLISDALADHKALLEDIRAQGGVVEDYVAPVDLVGNQADSASEQPKETTGANNEAIKQAEEVADNKISATPSEPRVPAGKQGIPDESGTKEDAGGIQLGGGVDEGDIRAQGPRDGLPKDAGLAGQRTNDEGERGVRGDSGPDRNVPGDIKPVDAGADQGGVSNYDLREKPSISLTPAKRRDINRLAEEVLKKPVNEITDADKEVLRQYTGSGGLDLKASQDKGAAVFNQHYTSYETIKAIYNALDEAGLAHGKALEPSVGSGNFIGMMPSLDWTAVDIDKTNTDIVSRLYPGVRVFNESYETFKGKNYDLIISNVPFASFASLAREHAGTIKPAFKAIHNFFFAQSVEKLKDGGVMAFMTSTGTMDGTTEAAKLRERLVQDLDVIGAYRLPMGTQKANASTEVMIDIIFLQKRPDGVESKQKARNQSFVAVGQKDGHKINQYFIDHPDSVLGELSVGKNKTSMGREGLIVTGDADYSKIKLTPRNYEAKAKIEDSSFKHLAEAEEYASNNGLYFSPRSQPFYEDGVFYGVKVDFSEQDGTALLGRKLDGVQQEKIDALVAIEKSLNPNLIEKYKDDYKKAPQKDKLLKAWGRKYLATARINELSALFDDNFVPSEIFDAQVRFEDSGKIEIDSDSSLKDRAESLENKDGVISTSASDLVSGLEVSKLLSNGDYARVSETKIQNARIYYSGNIYEKIDGLNKVKPAAQRAKQKEGLEAVKPAVIPFKELTIRGDESWLPGEAKAAIGRVERYDGSPVIGGNAISNSALLELYNKYINGEQLAKRDQKDTQDEYNSKLKAAQRTLTNDVLPLIKQHLDDSGMAGAVEEEYNRKRNFFSPPVFDGSSIKNLPATFRGKPFKLMQHQQEGAERAIYNKRGVIAFAPGLGKTPTAIIVTQQLLDKGVVKKPLFIVPANTIPQWEETARELYPNSKIYQFPKYQTGVNKGKVKDWVAMTGADKEKMANDLTNNRYDYTFISTNLAQKITVPTKKLNQYIEDIAKEMSLMEKPDDELTKSQVKAKATRLAKIAMLKETMRKAYSEANKAGFDMKKLGFDAIIADEVQYYKNIGMQSAETRGGIGASVSIKESWPKDEDGRDIKTGDPLAVSLQSSRSYDFRFKTRYISEMNNGNNVFLLTGTPTPNKPLELMTLLQHLNVDILKEYGISSAEEFVNEFFSISEVESTSADGKKKISPELTSIKNIGGLKAITTRYIDYRSPESAKDLKRPEQVDIKHQILKSDVSEAQFIDIKDRLLQAIKDAQEKRQGVVKDDIEAIISMYGAGRDASIDQRLYTPSIKSKDFSKGDVFEVEERSEYSKIAKTVELVAKQVKADKDAGQIIFLDRLKFANSNKSTHEDIRARVLSATKLNDDQVVFVSGSRHINPATGKPVNSGPKPERLQQIIDGYNSGDIKVLIGNTSKLGVGVDLQTNTTDIYQIDLPYRPDEIEQRNNRGVRQGNRYDQVRVHSFSQIGTFDEMSERIIANKKGFNDVFWKDQDQSTADVAAKEAPDAYAAAIELEQNPAKKKKLELERDLSSADRVTIELESKVASIEGRIQTQIKTKEDLDRAIASIDKGSTPAYAGLPAAEAKKKLAAFKKRQVETRAKYIAQIKDVYERIESLNTDQTDAEGKLKSHKENIKEIQSKYIINGVVALSKIKELHPELSADKGQSYSRDYKTTPAVSTVAEINTELSTAIARLDKTIQQRVKIVQTTAELPVQTPSDVKGMYYDGIAYVVADNTTVSDAKAVLTHEIVGHMGLEEMLGDSFSDVIGKIKRMKRVNNKQVSEIVRTLKKNYTDGNGNYALSANQEAREILAHIAETDTNHSLVKQLVAKLKLWLARMGLTNKDSAEIGQLIAQAARYIEGKRANLAIDGSGNITSIKYDGQYASKTIGDKDNERSQDQRFSRKTDSQEQQEDYAALIAEAEAYGARVESSGTLDGYRNGEEVTVLHRSHSAFDEFGDDQLGGNTSTTTGYLGHFLSFEDAGNDKYGAHLSAHKVQVEKVLSLSEGEFSDLGDLSKQESTAMRSALMSAGYDGIAVDGLDWVIVFESKNITKVADDTGASYSRGNVGGNTKWKDEPGYEDLPEGTFDSLSKFGKPPNPPAIDRAKERFAEIKPRFGTKLRQEVLDQYDSIKSVLNNKRAWMLSQMSGSAGGAIEMVIQEGGLKLHQDGVLQINTGMKGLAETLAPLGNESNRFLQWVAANRASRLWAEDKEHLLTEQDIQNLLALNQNTAANPTREATYAAVLKDFEALHNSVVKVGVETGLVSREDAALWKEQGFYVPFYRIAEEGGDNHGVSSVSGMVGQTAYKKLKGANMQLNDLLMNTVMNWEHIASASLKNQAATATLETAEEMGLATRLDRKPSKVEKNHIFIRENGQEAWYHLDSTNEGKLVLQAISSLNFNGLDNAPMKVMRKFKRLLTIGVTASGSFKVANAIRDTIQAIAVAPMDTNFLKNVHQGWDLTKKMSEERVQAIAAGGMFGDSGYINGGDPDAIRMVMSKHVSQAEILDTEHAIKKWWNKYQDFGARLENVNRIANVKQSKDAGKDLLTSNFEGRDHLDFQRSGANIAVRVLTQSIPFLNARAQGLDKMARAFADPEQRKQTIAVIGAYSAASVLLYLYMKDDEDYKEAEQWERDTYHLIKLPGSDKMVRIPRPFEVGALANIIERGVEQFADPEVDMSLYYERLQHMLTETLAFSIVPQALAPALDVRANKSSFTDRQIESMAMQRLSPGNRIKPWTTQSAIGLSKLLSMPMGEHGLSPIQIDFLVSQYAGWAGSAALNAVDLIARPALGKADRPEMKIQDYTVVGRFIREAKGRNSKYITELYDNKAFLAQKFADIKHYKENKEVDKLKAAMEKHGKDLRYRKQYNRVATQLSKLSNEIKRITERKDLSPAEKSRRIDRINAKRLRIARLAVRRGELESR